MDIIGKITQILEPETGTSARGEWSKQGFVIETQEQYPKPVFITIWNKKVGLDKFKVGDMVQVFINLSSREFNGKWYTDVQAWRIELPSPAGHSQDAPLPSTEDELIPENGKEELNDLPF